MDSTLPEDHHLKKASTSKSVMTRQPTAKATRSSKNPPKQVSLTTRHDNGDLIIAENMDVALLVLYGHILYSGNSFYPALNYYYRAYALDPENPGILLPIALCYIHHALKRQAENRHYLILQGLSFMSLYRKVRCQKKIEQEVNKDVNKDANKKTQTDFSSLSECQEVEYNYGRVYHSLGLLDQAIPCYERALEFGNRIQSAQKDKTAGSREKGKAPDHGEKKDEKPKDILVEDFSPEAAVALQNIYALNGNIAGAREVTEKYLII
ncbi:hypothetical protein EIK77_007021 [Talaromyces pinophilus]|nr:hypothetical protein EIK77_007021 [Talaromyces pinophilus]